MHVSSQKVVGFEPCEGFRSLRSELVTTLVYDQQFPLQQFQV